MFKKIFFSLNFNFFWKQIILFSIPSLLFNFLKINYSFFFSFLPSFINFIGLDIINIFFLNKILISIILFFFSIILIQLCFLLNIPFYIYFFFLNIFLGILSELFYFYNRIFLGCLIVSLFSFNLLLKFNFFIISVLFCLGILFWVILNIIWSYLFKNQFLRENIYDLYQELSLLIKYKYCFNYNINNNNYNIYILSHKKIMDLIIIIYEQLDTLFFFKDEKYFLIKIFKTAIYLKDNLFINFKINRYNFKNFDKKKKKFFKKYIIILSKIIFSIGLNILYKKYIILNKSLINKIKYFNKNLYKFNKILNIIYLKNIIFYLLCLNNKKSKKYSKIFNDIIFIYDSRIIKYLLNFNINNYRYFLKLTFYFNLFFILFKNQRLFKYYWILITIIYINQNNYFNILIKIYNRFLGVLIGIIISIFLIKLNLNKLINFILMFFFTNISYLLIKNNYFISIIGFTISSFLNNKLFYLNILNLFYLRLLDIFIGCFTSLIFNSFFWLLWDINFFKKNIRFIFIIYKRIFSKKFNNFNLIKINNIKINFLINQMQNNIFTYYFNFNNEYFFNKIYFKYINLLIINNYILLENINSIFILVKFKSLNEKNILFFLNIFRKYIYINCKNFSNYNFKKDINFFINIIYKKKIKFYKNFKSKIFIYHLYKINKHILIINNIFKNLI